MFNIWESIKFETRQDVFEAHDELFEPLVQTFSRGGGRVRISETGSSCTPPAAELEGFLRPLWGIVPYIRGGGHFKHAELYRRGIVNGCNPKHPDYWGTPGDFDQILVDVAAIAFALCLTTEVFWDPLLQSDKDIVVEYLQVVSSKEFCGNNWKFFKVLVDIALETIGAEYDKNSTEQYLQDLESLYLGEGWYGDGKRHRIDNYNPFAFHFYSMIYVLLKRDDDPERCSRFIERANLFAKDYIHFYSDDGAVVHYGRSLNYRFAVIGFWGVYAAVLDKVSQAPPIPWGVIKGIYLDHFKWWSHQPILNFGSKLLTLGYSYPNLFMTERYNSPQSPYWCTKAFSALLLDQSHPFWTAEVEPLKLKPKYLLVVGIHLSHYKGNTVALINGPWNDEYQTEKYTKFAYSSRYGFGIISNHRTFEQAHIDNMLAFSFNNREFFVREEYQAWVLKDGKMKSIWKPVTGIEVESWIIPGPGYHTRIHKIQNNTEFDVVTREGGYAIHLEINAERQVGEKRSLVQTTNDLTIIQGLGGDRVAGICQPEPNTNLLFPKSLLPVLIGTIPKRESTTYSCVVYANPSANGEIQLPTSVEFDLPESIYRIPCNI